MDGERVPEQPGPGSMSPHPPQPRRPLRAQLGTQLRFRIVTVLLNWLSGSLCKASSAS